MSPSRLHLILVPSILALAAPAWAEVQANAKTQSRPLNLSLPRDVLQTPGAGQADETVQRNLRAPAPLPGNTQAPPQLRYGAGYEHRQQEMRGNTPGGSAGTGSAAGSGRRRR